MGEPMRGIVQGRMVDAAHYERLLRIEAVAREVAAAYLSAECISDIRQEMGQLQAALGSLREGG